MECIMRAWIFHGNCLATWVCPSTYNVLKRNKTKIKATERERKDGRKKERKNVGVSPELYLALRSRIPGSKSNCQNVS